jgi:uncharacterized protein (TIGR02118 family)
MLYRATVLYPAKPGSRFDFDYYLTKHMPQTRAAYAPYGLVRMEVDRGISGGRGGPPPFVCVSHLYWNSLEARDRAIVECSPALMADIPNFTDVFPEVVVSEVNVIE